MGMNIYTLDGKHIGKRHADGIWCWDCKTPVIREKIGRFIYSKKPFTCPKCKLTSENTNYNPAYRELGFDKSKPKKHTGIDGANSFTWQGKTINEAKKRLNRKRFVKTEYGEKWTIKQFWEMFNDIITEKCFDREFS